VQGEVLQGNLAVAAAEERDEPQEVDQEGDHRALIFPGSKPTDQPLTRRTEFWRRTALSAIPRGFGDAARRTRGLRPHAAMLAGRVVEPNFESVFRERLHGGPSNLAPCARCTTLETVPSPIRRLCATAR